MNELVHIGTKELPVIEWKGQRVITTAQLADVYETETDNVKKNFQSNKTHFKEGEHFFLLKGADLKEFKNRVTDFPLVGKNANQLYLWTRRGASRHCKMLGTDKAWEQFDALEENYYNQTQTVIPTGEELMALAVIEAHKMLEQKDKDILLEFMEEQGVKPHTMHSDGKYMIDDETGEKFEIKSPKNRMKKLFSVT